MAVELQLARFPLEDEMPRPTRISDLDDVKAWIAEHDGRIDAYWSQQFRLNIKCEEKHALLDRRVGSLEKRVWLMAFAGAGLGAGAAQIAPQFFGG